ncbi:MAG: 2-oxoacid:acceptor oxidoreductase family protein [Verrucomicrobia bacterium]|nr:2-oxoacid:acceptor oxidoreductase family protein [Verrucomicrobiota bacterium]
MSTSLRRRLHRPHSKLIRHLGPAASRFVKIPPCPGAAPSLSQYLPWPVKDGKLPAVKVDPRFTKDSGREVFTGNELLVKGCLETQGGTHLWTGYPGSPIAGFFDTAQDIAELLREHGIRATIANNEALGAAMVNGSQMHGLRAIALQKSVGVHVAADALALGNLVGAHPEGGAVIVLGDDPWSDSTQVPADSRYIAKHLMMPVLEPSDAQELKDWINLAFTLSRESELYIGYLVTTNQADGGGSVTVFPNQFPAVNTRQQTTLDTATIDFERNVLLPPRTWRKEQNLPERFARLWAGARRLGANRTIRPKDSNTALARLGFITSAAAYCYLEHALAELGLTGQCAILKLGVTYPLDPELILEFAADKSDLFVIEERRGFLEEQTVEIISRARQAEGRAFARLNVWGKLFPHGLPPIPSTRGLNPSKLIERLGKLFLTLPDVRRQVDAARVQHELDLIAEVKSIQVEVAPRTPTFCPGCPHRDSASVLVEIKKQFRDPLYMQRAHGTGPVDLVFHGDTGCYTMLMFEPTKDLMHNYSGMGLGGGTGAGIDPFIRNKQVVFMGDSTFFHSGQIAISNSLKNHQDITYILLDNKTTAMTGHQPTPGLEENLMGDPTYAQNIQGIIDAMINHASEGVTVVRVNPAERDTYRQLLEKTILQNGVKVILADKECGITFHRRQTRAERGVLRAKGFLPVKQHINIAPEVCENCLECTKATGCPGLTLEKTPYGQKVQIDLSWCVSDGACTRFMVTPAGGGALVKACPAFEEVTVKRSRKPPPLIDQLDFQGLPAPTRQTLTGTWHGYLAGVGGMGIGTATAILVLAGQHEGYHVRFCDKKGLAIRNGGVYSMITFSPPGVAYSSNLIPYGKADLILGVDVLEAARAIDPSTNQRVGSRTRTAVVVNTHKTPTILTLLGKDDFQVERLEALLRQHTRAEAYVSHNVSALSEKFFGTQLYANIMMLGIAFQRGLLPLTLASLEQAIKTNLGPAATENLQAFNLGRQLAHAPAAIHQLLPSTTEPTTFTEVVADKTGLLRRRGQKLAAAYEELIERTTKHLRLDPVTLGDFARRVYDLIQFENVAYARRYASQVLRVHGLDRPEHQFAVSHAVLWNLHRVMLIKDEVYVAHLLTSEEKYRRDRARYNVDPRRGDRLEYRHLNRPQFRVLGLTLAWNMKSRDWMLRLMKHLRWLRRALPEWHREEKAFRDWYGGLVEGLTQIPREPARYEMLVRILRLPEEVTGYREIRYPKMTAARAQAEQWLAQLAHSPEENLQLAVA